MATVAYPGTPGTVLYGGLPTPSGGTALTTITLANTSATEQGAGFVSPMFGLPLKQGDVPAGQYPQFTLADDTPVPATVYADTSWPDASKKFCGAFARVPASVPGSGSLAITVKNGGSAPGASSRTLSDLTAADLKVELTGVTNLSGVWTASLNDAITDAADIVVIGDGPAGKVWRIGGPFKQAGSPHGQLYCWHYVLAAQNASGGLSHLMYLGRVALPWADVSTPTPTRLVVNAVVKSGAAVIRTLQGHDTTETVGANIGMPHYSSFFTAGSDGKWDFVQGGGSALADCTVRVVHEKAYRVKTRLLEPIDTTVSQTSNASVDYAPYCKGAFGTRSINTTGNSNFIGLMPEWSVTHLLTQAAVDERAVRVSALASGGFRTCVRKSATKRVIPVADIQPYVGLGAAETTWAYGGGTHIGVQAPSDTSSLWSGETDSTHRPNAHYYAYAITGEPQYLDMMIEQAAQIVMYTQPGDYERNVSPPIASLSVGTATGRRNIKVGSTTYKGAGVLLFGDTIRTSAWATRDIAQALAMSPAGYDGGVDVYLSDVLSSAHQMLNALNAAMPSSWRDGGLYSVASRTATSVSGDAAYESPWMTMYLSMSLCHQSQIIGTADSQTARAHVAKFISSVHSQMDVTALTAYRWKQWDGNGNLVLSAQDVLFRLTCTLTFDPDTDRATISGANGDWTPTNGDKVAFASRLDADKPFAGATDEKVFFVVNASGSTFQLSETAGGSVVDVTSAVTVSPAFYQIQNASPLNTFASSGDVELKLARGAARFHEACGDSMVSSARAKLDANLASAGSSFATDPRWAYATTFGA